MFYCCVSSIVTTYRSWSWNYSLLQSISNGYDLLHSMLQRCNLLSLSIINKLKVSFSKVNWFFFCLNYNSNFLEFILNIWSSSSCSGKMFYLQPLVDGQKRTLQFVILRTNKLLHETQIEPFETIAKQRTINFIKKCTKAKEVYWCLWFIWFYRLQP